MTDFIHYAFIQRALVAGTFVGISCAVLGVFLVLRRLSMIGDGLAHTGFASIALGLVLGVTPIYVAIPATALASLVILSLSEKNRLFGDTAIALISSLAVAVGILLASISGGFNVDLFSYLFGSILAISSAEVITSVFLSIAVTGIVVFLYSKLFSITYDDDFARVSGIKVTALNRLLIILTALTVVIGIRVVGTMLISSLLIFPAVTALRIARSFTGTVIFAAVIATVSVIIGIILSFFLNLPTGAMIVMINFIIFIGISFIKNTHPR